jgi:hypothetical protein
MRGLLYKMPEQYIQNNKHQKEDKLLKKVA